MPPVRNAGLASSAPACQTGSGAWVGTLLVGLSAAVAGLALLAVFSPGYLTERGFPLDDAWIHAVYGRELAHSGLLAYNRGIAATGETSILWACLVALPHLAGLQTEGVVLTIKLLGFALHLATAVVSAWAVAGQTPRLAGAGAILFALYPPLLAASVSGMEVPLAGLAAWAVVASFGRRAASWFAIASAVAPLARPELGLLALALPLLAIRDPGGVPRALRLWAAGGLGTLASVSAMGLRNLAVSGRPLPATFYAKVGAPLSLLPDSLGRGFTRLLGDLPLTTAPLLVIGAALASVALWSRSEEATRIAGTAWLTGVGLCGLSFALIPPIDPQAFYHQRYALPGVALLLPAAPVLAKLALRGVGRLWLRRLMGGGLAVTTAASLALDLPGRLEHLENDARNIDDVQVALGRVLVRADPSERVWAVDAGAVRYFGGAFVVDTLGLNTPQVLGFGAASFLAAHQPTFLEVVPGWSSISITEGGPLIGWTFAPTTPYTVTSFKPMQRHLLLRCRPPVRGDFEIRRRRLGFECTSATSPLAP